MPNNNYNKNNIFAKIIRAEIPCNKVYEDEFILSFYDVNPASKIHVLVIPKGEFICYSDFIQNATNEEIVSFFSAIPKIAKMLNLLDKGYRIISNEGSDASQTVEHFHVHILGGEKLGGLVAKDKYIR